jgi:branched-chain amino acid transport system ATP-binding protein
VLELRGLVVRYGPIEAVRGVDLVLGRGRLLTLLGANGAGKTSLLMAVMGLVRPAAGRILHLGEPVEGRPPEALARRRIALVPEGRRVFANLAVEENLLLGGAAHGGAAERARRRDAQYARFPVLAERRRQPAGLLSGGEQQMLAVARALMAAPDLLLLDEPSLGLAPQVVSAVFRLIGELRRDGITILLVEQNVHRALAIADDAVVLRNGRVQLAGPAAALVGSAAVGAAYLDGEAAA